MGKNKGKRALETKKDKKKKNKKKEEHKILKLFIIIILLILIALASRFVYYTYKNGGGLQGVLATALGHDENTKKNLPEFKALLMGISIDIDTKLTDTIIVASYNPNTQKATMMSIPRDTFVGYSEKKATGSDKINAIYSIKNGPEGVLEEVNELTDLDIKYYAVVETDALVKLVDAIGGVTFNVPIDMKYDDPTQNLHIDLKAGEQEIDGAKAEQLLRFRHNNNGTSYPAEYGDNDIGRMRTQREFMSETMRQTLKVENIFKLGQILDIAKESIETNINFNDAKDYLPYLVEFKTENLVSDTLPGQPKMMNDLWFYKCDEKATKELVNKLFYKRDNAEGEDTNTTNTTKTTSKTTSAENKTKEQLNIQIVDGTGGTDKYEKAIQALEAAGFKVTKPTTTTSKSKKKTNTTPITSSRTVITNQKYANDEIINEIKTILGTGDISNNASTTSQSDISITIGTDYQ